MQRTLESVNKFSAGSLFLAALLLLCPVSGQATPQTDELARLKNVQLEYGVYLGGIHVLTATTQFARTGQRYEVKLDAGTKGFLRSVAPWDANVTSKGRWVRQGFQPQHSTVLTRWQDDEKKVMLDFDTKGRAKAHFEPPEGENKHEDVPDDLLQGALDPLTGVVQMMASFAYGQGCEQVVPIFDGHRRFDLVLTELGDYPLTGGDYSVYSGNATKCEADLTMRAGSRKDREGSRFWEDAKGANGEKAGNRPPVYVYLAKVRDDLPAIPVRVETSTVFGSVMVHLQGIEGETVSAAAP